MQKWQIKSRDGHASICQGSPYQTVKSYAWQELQVCRTGWRQKKNKREGKKKIKGGKGEERKNNSWYMSRKSNMMSRRKNQLSEQNVGQSIKERDFKCISLTNMVK